jgi:uncharacterized integral membrane protein
MLRLRSVHEAVKACFLFWQITGLRVVVMILTVAVGCLIGWLVAYGRKKTRRHSRR